jgi:ATP-binding cassette subfamily C protein
MRDDARDADIFDAAELADVHEMISSFAQGYETIVGMDGSPLSGGQRQRIGLARAFYGNPRLMVLDEPNSNLDANGERALAKALLRAKERLITVVTVTQRAALLRSVDKIMILNGGAISALGPRDDVIPLITGRKPNAPGDGPPVVNS